MAKHKYNWDPNRKQFINDILMICFKHFSDENKKCKLSIKKICDFVDFEKEDVVNATRDLELNGFISVENGVYFLLKNR